MRSPTLGRSELVALDVADIEDVPEGLLITIRRSKTDQEGQGRKVAIPRGEIACPVAAVTALNYAVTGIVGTIEFGRLLTLRCGSVRYACKPHPCDLAILTRAIDGIRPGLASGAGAPSRLAPCFRRGHGR
jgi:hypothetical protein